MSDTISSTSEELSSYTIYYQDNQGDVTAWRHCAANQPEWALAA